MPYSNIFRMREELAFKFEARFGKTIKPPPEQAVGGDDHGSQGDGAGEEEIKILGVGGRGNHGADAYGRIDLALEVEIFGDDAGVPRAPGGRNHPGNEKGENSGQDQFPPALPA